MKLISSLRQALSPEVQETAQRCAVGVTIGNFDGMHLGHQALFKALDEELSREASAVGRPPLKVMLTFAPHPRRVLGRKDDRARNKANFPSLTSLHDKAALADGFGFDYLFLRRFTPSFAALEPHEFVDRYIVSGLKARVVVVGYDWSFGKGRAGTADTLCREGAARGFKCIVVPPMELAGERVSSTLVRQALEAGDLARLEDLLGRRFAFSGIVRKGDQRGRQIGFPTANLVPGEQLLPPDGVYAVFVRRGGERLPAVCNIGIRPTFGGESRLIEAHILDRSGLELYGERLIVEFVARLRGEKKFGGITELQAQIAADAAEARQLLDDAVRG